MQHANGIQNADAFREETQNNKPFAYHQPQTLSSPRTNQGSTGCCAANLANLAKTVEKYNAK